MIKEKPMKTMALVTLAISAATAGVIHTTTPPVLRTAAIELDDTVIALAGAFGNPEDLKTKLQGEVTNGNTFDPLYYVNVAMPSDMAAGAARLDAELHAVNGPVTIFGYSEGADVTNYWLNHYAPTTNLDLSQIKVVEIGDSIRRYGGVLVPVKVYGGPPPVDTPVQITDVAKQYDQWADTPNNTSSPYYHQAVNEVNHSGEHLDYNNVSLTDPNNTTYAEGNITYVLAPSALPSGGLTRDQIESAYNRPEPVPAGQLTTAPVNTPVSTPPKHRVLQRVVSHIVSHVKNRGKK